MSIETINKNGYTIQIEQDQDPQNPRKDCDQLGIMVHWHRRYDLGDREIDSTERDALQRGGFKLLARYLRMKEGGINIIPMGLLDHSGLHVYAEGGSHWSDAQGWDSGTVGFIYANTETIKATGAPLDSIDRQLHGEIEEYDQYLRGDVYGYVIEDSEGNDVDSCWGFYGFDYCKQEAESALEYHIKHEAEEQAKIAVCMAL